MMKNYLILLLFSLFPFFIHSQNYIFPINPNSQNYLSGNLGELRGDHFHMGIDIKTFGKMNLPVYAAESGYVERLRVSGTGYGKAIYIKHNNGMKTVYAHLNSFNNFLDSYVTNYQYRNKKFIVNLYPGKKFYFKKGDIIGYSGNSGSSGGPHLHFEYRDSLDIVYNPLNLKFREVIDTRKPTINIISFKTLDLNSRVNNHFGISNYNISTKNNIKNNYNFMMSGKIGISILSHDMLDGYQNKVGINRIKLFVNDSLFIDNKIDYLSYSETNLVSRYIDFDLYKKLRKQYIKLYQDDGNNLNFHNNNSNGIINVEPDKTYKITIEVFDSYNNKTEFSFFINKKNIPIDITDRIDLFENDYFIIDNTIVIRSELTNRDLIEIENQKTINNINYNYKDNNYKYYLIDLRKNLPVKGILNEKEIHFNLINLIPSNKLINVSNNHFDLSVNKKSLFDTLYLSFKKTYDSRNIYEFNNLMTFNQSVILTLKPEKKYDNKISHVYNVAGKKPNFIGGEWLDGKIKFKTRSFSKFSIISDTDPPEINPIKISDNIIKIRIKDELSGIKKYEGKINNQWILFEYDNKNDVIISKKLNSVQSFKGNFVLVVYDNANNKSTYNINI